MRKLGKHPIKNPKQKHSLLHVAEDTRTVCFYRKQLLRTTENLINTDSQDLRQNKKHPLNVI